MRRKFIYKIFASHTLVLLAMMLLFSVVFHFTLPKLMYQFKVQELMRTGEYLLTLSPKGLVFNQSKKSLHVRYWQRNLPLNPKDRGNGPYQWLTDEQWESLNQGNPLSFQRERMHFSVPMTVVFIPAKQNEALMLAAPMVETEKAIQTIQAQLGTVLAITLLFSLLLSFVLSRGLHGRIGKMRLLAERIAKGDYAIRIPIAGKDEIAELGEDLNEVAVKLEQARKEAAHHEQLRSQFLADISHELKTPLTSMRGLIEALRNRMIQAEEEERIYFLLEKETFRLIRLVQSVMNLEKIRSHQVTLQMRSFLLAPVLADIAEAFKIQAEEKGFMLSVDVEEGLTLTADEDQLRQMVINLVKNAIQFTEEGEVRLQAYEDTDWIYVEVSDTGIGIPLKEQQDIFERFYKVDPSRTASQGEMGLGLALVKQLALAHGGDVTVKSMVGKGSIFTILLPKK